MKIQTFKNPNRRRKLKINYYDPNFCKYYDLDLTDFGDLVQKLQNNERLTEQEMTVTACIY